MIHHQLDSALLHAILDTAVDGIITIDESGQVLSFNRAAERIFGHDAAEVIGQNVSMLMPEPDHSHHDEYLAHYLETGERRIIGIGREVRGRRKDGTEFPMNLGVSEVNSDQGRCFAGFVQDVTELRRSQRLASIGTATAMLAHEIGNPLNSMSLSAQLIDRRLNKLDVDVDEIREWNDTIKREIRRLTNLLGEFRALARDTEIELEPTLVSELFDVALEAKRPALEANRVRVSVELDNDLVVLANREKMQQVLVNLIKNAREAMPDGGELRLGALDGEGTVVLTIGDTGPGIPESVDVFAPFETTKSCGTGLGLAVVSQILTCHGGRAWHEPGPSGGAQFCLELVKCGDQPGP